MSGCGAEVMLADEIGGGAALEAAANPRAAASLLSLISEEPGAIVRLNTVACASASRTCPAA
jgi:hypothetical protein